MAKKPRCPRPVNRIIMMRTKGFHGPFAQNTGVSCIKSVGNYLGSGMPGDGFRVRSGVVVGDHSVSITFSRAADVAGPAFSFLKINGGTITCNGVAETSPAVWVFTAVAVISPGDIVEYSYENNVSNVITDAVTGEQLDSQSIPVSNAPAVEVVPVFNALQPDPTTGVMTPVLKGIGTVADTRGSTYWEKGEDGIYYEFGIGELAWSGGRVTGPVGSRVVYGTDAGGTPLPEAPYAVSGIAATNIARYSIDMDSFFTPRRFHTITSTSEIAPNGSLTATVMEDADAGARLTDQKNFNASGGIVFDVGNSYCFSEFIKKSAPGSLHCAVGVNVSGGAGGTRVNRIVFNPNTGAITATLLTDSSGVEDCGEYWRVWLGVTDINDGATVMAYQWSSAYNMDGSATADDSAVGSQTIWGNQVEFGLTPTAPIITEGVPVSNAASTMSFDPANHDDTVGTYYFEAEASSASNIIDGFLSHLGTSISLYDGANNQSLSADLSMHKIGFVYGSGTMRLNVDGAWHSVGPYNGALLQGITDLFRGATAVGEIRNLKRYDSDDESIIDGLMP